MTQKLAIISLGSNLGDWETIFKSAIQSISKLGAIDLISPIYKTEPWGLKEQPWFKNQVIGLYIDSKPFELLNNLMAIEKALGRNRKEEIHWGPRTLDLDIILFGDQIISEAELIIPHPRMQDRKFILKPLCDIYPQVVHPILFKNMAQLSASCNDKTELFKISHVL